MTNEVKTSERLWSEEVGIVDPAAVTPEKDIAYEFSNGRTFKDGDGVYGD